MLELKLNHVSKRGYMCEMGADALLALVTEWTLQVQYAAKLCAFHAMNY